MKKFLRVLMEVTADALCGFAYFIENNLTNFANVLNLILPYLMYLIGQYVALDRGEFATGGELFIPVIFVVITYYLKSSANKLGKGITVPVPEKRFTQVDDDGEVNVENRRVQELILYLADLEDWLERKGLL